MRRLYRARRRQSGAIVRGAGVGGRQRADHHPRGARHAGQAASTAARLHRRASVPVRLLRQRHGDGGKGAARSESAAQRTRHQASAEHSSVPLRFAQPDRARGAARRARAGMSTRLSRRDFLQAGGALVIGFALAPALAPAQQGVESLPGSLNNNRLLDAWLRVDPNGNVTLFTGKVELGQGIATALAQIAADELDVDLKRVEVVTGDTARTPNE